MMAVSQKGRGSFLLMPPSQNSPLLKTHNVPGDTLISGSTILWMYREFEGRVRVPSLDMWQMDKSAKMALK